MTDVAFTTAPAGAITVLDLWHGDSLPATLAGLRTLKVEPRRWWLFDAPADTATIIGDAGALAPIGGGLIRATITGPGWRALLMISGVFDAEDAGFAPGSIAATIIHHVPVWIAVTGAEACEVFYPASYANALHDLWTNAIAAGIAA